MATTPISGYSTTRITGLASGMDTDSLVSKLMKTEQMKYDRVYQQNTKLEWKKQAYTNINTKLKDFRDKFMSAVSPDNVMSQGVYKSYKVNYTENKYVDIKATSGAGVGSHKITGISKADYAKLEGMKHRNRNISAVGSSGKNFFASATGEKVVQPEEALSDVFSFDSADQQLSFSVNGETFTFKQDEKVSDVINKVNSSPAGVKMSVDSDGKIFIENKEKGNKNISIKNGTDSPIVIGTDGIFGKNETIAAKNLIDDSMTLADIEAATGKDILDSSDNLKMKINGQEFSFDKDTTLSDMMDTINESTGADVKISYDTDADKFIIRNNSAGTGTKLEFENVAGNAFGEDGLFSGIKEGTTTKFESINRDSDTIKSAAEKMGISLSLDGSDMFSFTLKTKNSKGEEVSKDFSFDPAKTTLKSMMDKVNSDTDLNVKMSYSQITDSFTISSGTMGEDSWFSVENKDGSSAFGGADSFFGIDDGKEATGKDAELRIDGELVKRNSNSFVLDGIEFNLKTDMAEVPVDDDKAISFSLSQDADAVVTKVKTFVEEYNKLIKGLTDQIRENYDYKKGYVPLTEAERADMSKEEIEVWEVEAKKGLLRNDTTINSMLTSMRAALFEKVGDTGLSPHDIGLSIGYLSTDGSISFDENKFRAALKENPDTVGQVMASVSDSSDAKIKREGSGFVSRAFDSMTETQNTLTKTNIKNINQSVYDNENKMTDMISRMYEMEERYYMQFAQMEQLMSQYQSQSNWLTQQLGQM